MDEMIDTHIYPHGPYAMGALDNLSDVIVYYINVSTKNLVNPRCIAAACMPGRRAWSEARSN